MPHSLPTSPSTSSNGDWLVFLFEQQPLRTGLGLAQALLTFSMFDFFKPLSHFTEKHIQSLERGDDPWPSELLHHLWSEARHHIWGSADQRATVWTARGHTLRLYHHLRLTWVGGDDRPHCGVLHNRLQAVYLAALLFHSSQCSHGSHFLFIVSNAYLI